jgi:hypothetical protein
MTVNGLLPAPENCFSTLTDQGIVSVTFRRAVASRYPREDSMERRVLVGVDGGSREHTVEVVNEETGEEERFKISNDHAGCD